jgi:hypothetical protein
VFVGKKSLVDIWGGGDRMKLERKNGEESPLKKYLNERLTLGAI